MGQDKLLEKRSADKQDGQVEGFILENRQHLDSVAIAVLRSMDVADQRRVIAVGPVTACENPTTALQARVRKAREMESVYMSTVGGAKLSKATLEEAENFVKVNIDSMDDYARKVFLGMDAEDQHFVIVGGPLEGTTKAATVMQGRVKRARAIRAELAPSSRPEANSTRHSATALPLVDAETAALLQDQFCRCPIKAVPIKERRHAAPARKVIEEAESQLVGTVKGIGGVVEILKPKYNSSKGDRLSVSGESDVLWKLQGGKTIPKAHENQGWRWVISAGEQLQSSKDDIEERPKIAEEHKCSQAQRLHGVLEQDKLIGGKAEEDKRKEERKHRNVHRSHEVLEQEELVGEKLELDKKQEAQLQQEELKRVEGTRRREEEARRRDEDAKKEEQEAEARRLQEQARRREEDLKRRREQEARKKAEEKIEEKRIRRIARIHAELARRQVSRDRRKYDEGTAKDRRGEHPKKERSLRHDQRRSASSKPCHDSSYRSQSDCRRKRSRNSNSQRKDVPREPRHDHRREIRSRSRSGRRAVRIRSRCERRQGSFSRDRSRSRVILQVE